MTRISPGSFYWWIAPVLAAVGWLAFSLRGVLEPKKAQASLFLLALTMSNLIYFFGRSNEHNLLNVSASLLFCLFLGIDLALSMFQEQRSWTRWALKGLPWVFLAAATFVYAGRLTNKVYIQTASVMWHQALPPIDDTGPINCGEISAAIRNDRRVFVFGDYDYWFYEKCGYVPQGYFQPLLLEPLSVQLKQQMDGLLSAGYKVVIPKVNRLMSIDVPAGVYLIQTEHYYIFWRA